MNDKASNYDGWIDRDAYDRTGEKIGTIREIYYDRETGRPEWLTVTTGLFGMKSNFAPITGSTQQDDGLRLDVTEDLLKDAPSIDAEEQLSDAEEQRLYSHYGITQAGEEGYTHPERGQEGYNTADRADRDYDVTDTITRHEEEMSVGTRTEEVGNVRLRKYVTTDTETVTVPVQKEKVVVERTSVDDTTGGTISEEVAEVTVSEEVPVVDTEVVAKEEIGIRKETTTEQRSVSADVQKEHVEVEDDSGLIEDQTDQSN